MDHAGVRFQVSRQSSMLGRARVTQPVDLSVGSSRASSRRIAEWTGACFFFLGRSVLNADSCDAMSFHCLYRKTMPFVVEEIANSWDPLQASHNKTSECFEAAVTRENQVVLTLEIQEIVGALKD